MFSSAWDVLVWTRWPDIYFGPDIWSGSKFGWHLNSDQIFSPESRTSYLDISTYSNEFRFRNVTPDRFVQGQFAVVRNVPAPAANYATRALRVHRHHCSIAHYVQCLEAWRASAILKKPSPSKNVWVTWIRIICSDLQHVISSKIVAIDKTLVRNVLYT